MLQPKQYIEILDSVKLNLSKEQLKNIHFYSTYNFLLAFDKLQGDKEKETVNNLLQDYFKILTENNFDIEKGYSKQLFRPYIMKIGQYYNFQLGFKPTMGLPATIFAGILVDLLLLTMGILKKVYFFPIATFFLFTYNRYLYFSYGKKNKLYGPRF